MSLIEKPAENVVREIALEQIDSGGTSTTSISRTSLRVRVHGLAGQLDPVTGRGREQERRAAQNHGQRRRNARGGPVDDNLNDENLNDENLENSEDLSEEN